MLLIDFVVPCRSAQHERFRWGVDFDDLMIDTSGKATKLAGADGEPFSLDLNYHTSAENDEAFIAVLMGMR